MARFMDIHDGFVGITEAQLAEAHAADLAVEAEDGMHFEKAWLDPESGKVFCMSTGPSKEAVMRVHERAGHPTHEVYEITVACSEATTNAIKPTHQSCTPSARMASISASSLSAKSRRSSMAT